VHQQLMGHDKGLGEAPDEKAQEVEAKVAELSSQKTDAEAKLAKANAQLSSQKAESDTKLEAMTSAYRKYSSTMSHVVFDIKERCAERAVTISSTQLGEGAEATAKCKKDTDKWCLMTESKDWCDDKSWGSWMRANCQTACCTGQCCKPSALALKRWRTDETDKKSPWPCYALLTNYQRHPCETCVKQDGQHLLLPPRGQAEPERVAAAEYMLKGNFKSPRGKCLSCRPGFMLEGYGMAGDYVVGRCVQDVLKLAEEGIHIKQLGQCFRSCIGSTGKLGAYGTGDQLLCTRGCLIGAGVDH